MDSFLILLLKHEMVFTNKENLGIKKKRLEYIEKN